MWSGDTSARWQVKSDLSECEFFARIEWRSFLMFDKIEVEAMEISMRLWLSFSPFL